MGFNPFRAAKKAVKKVTKAVSSAIPKQLRPYAPYAAAFIPGGMGLSAGLQSMGGSAFLKAAIARGIIDPDADLKDVLKTGIMAAAPQAISSGVGSLGQGSGRVADFLNKTKTLKDGTQTISIVDRLSSMANPETLGGAAKVVGTLGTVDAAAKFAELNQQEIDKYNQSLLSGGMQDKGARRNAIFQIYMNTGTHEADDVNAMLDKFGYATGGIAGLRSGYENGGTVTITQEEYDRLKSGSEDAGFDRSLNIGAKGLAGLSQSGHSIEPVPMLRFATGGEVIEESETLMAGGPYKSGRDVQDAFNVWSGMGADDKSLFEGFLDFYKQGSWRDQIMGQADVEENTMMASAPSLEDSLNEKSLMMFRKPYYELTEEEVELLNEMATGGRVGYAGGGASYNKSERYSILAKKFNKGIPLTPDEAAELEMLEMTYADPHKMAQGGIMNRNLDMAGGGQANYEAKIKELMDRGLSRPMAEALVMSELSPDAYEILDVDKKADGGIMNRNLLNTGVDKDMRGGGFIPEGTKEKADDVPARLSKNEFVMTADAVRAAGGGSVNKGAQRMYNIMNQLEAKA